MEPTDLLQWPVVPPEQRPKKLFHAGLVDKKADEYLIGAGWLPIDVRLLPNETDEHRRYALKAWLEGIRFGTIELDPRLAKWLELESKVYEIHKGVPEKPKDDPSNRSDSQSTTFLLSFGTDRPYSTSWDEKLAKTKRKGGRKSKADKEMSPPDEDEDEE
jgi:hypothetical protein